MTAARRPASRPDLGQAVHIHTEITKTQQTKLLCKTKLLFYAEHFTPGRIMDTRPNLNTGPYYRYAGETKIVLCFIMRPDNVIRQDTCLPLVLL